MRLLEKFQRISEENKNLCEKEISLDELHNALLSLSDDSSPGSDGLTPSFYIAFWPVLQQSIFQCFKESIEKQELSLSHRRGIITLLHKGNDLSKTDMNNYRPITVTNCDYKIFSKLLALRLQSVIKSIIHKSQSGYIKGRSISNNIRLIDDIIKFANEENIPGLAVSLDFSKAFDSLSKSSILYALDCFNFGNVFKNYIQTIISNSLSAVKNGGWISSWFKAERGVRQGCCVSPLLFVLTVELLAIKLRENENIQSLLGNQHTIGKDSKTVSHADDITLFLKGKVDLTLTLKIIDDFGKFSGLKLNRKKCKALSVGGLDVTNTPEAEDEVKWLKKGDKIKILGIFFSAEKEASLISDNWEGKIKEIKKSITRWCRRDLSLYGKIIVAKTFLLSKISYVIQSLSLPQTILNEIDLLLFKFLWQKQNTNRKAFEKVKRAVLCLDIDKGGLKMIRVQDQQQVFLIKWITRSIDLDETEHTSVGIINMFFKNLGGIRNACRSNLDCKEYNGLNLIKSHFWRNAFSTFLTIKTKFIQTNHKVAANDSIFNNTFLRFKGKPIFIGNWIKNGILKVEDMIENGHLKTLEEIKMKLGNYGGLLFDYLAVVNGIKNSSFSFQTLINSTNNEDKIYPEELVCKNYRLREIIIGVENLPISRVNFWKRKYNKDIMPYFSLASQSTKESRLRLLHFKILHNIYPTNILLNKMKIKESDRCETCKEIDFIEHTFYHCKNIKHIWNKVSEIIQLNMGIKIALTETMVLFGITKNDASVNNDALNFINHILLIAKMAISKVKYGKIKNINLIFEKDLELRKISMS